MNCSNLIKLFCLFFCFLQHSLSGVRDSSGEKSDLSPCTRACLHEPVYMRVGDPRWVK